MFVLNKVDIFERPEDVEEVTAFVEDNARDLLGVTSATVLPVSARQALDAKLDAGAGGFNSCIRSPIACLAHTRRPIPCVCSGRCCLFGDSARCEGASQHRGTTCPQLGMPGSAPMRRK